MSDNSQLTQKQINDLLQQAQNLLNVVYNFACDNALDELESKLSTADTMIVEALNLVPEIKRYRVRAQYIHHLYVDVVASNEFEARVIALETPQDELKEDGREYLITDISVL
jgi:hypothetical protein